MGAVHFSTLAVTNANPGVILLSANSPPAKLVFAIPPTPQANSDLRTLHLILLPCTLFPTYSQGSLLQSLHLCSNAHLAKEGPDPSPNAASPFLAWLSSIAPATISHPACLALFLYCLSLPGAEFCLSCSLSRLQDPQDDGSLWECGDIRRGPQELLECGGIVSLAWVHEF